MTSKDDEVREDSSAGENAPNRRLRALVLQWLGEGNILQHKGDSEGYVPLSELRQLRRAVRMGVTSDELQRAVRDCEEIEFDESGDRIRLRSSAPADGRGDGGQPSTSRPRTTSQKVDQLRRLLDFWCGNANLRRDRFLAQRLRESDDETVPLELFLTFNKVKRQSASLDELREAVRSSEKLQLSADESRVGRRSKFRDELAALRDTLRDTLRADVRDQESALQDAAAAAADERTVYIEPLPSDVSHEAIMELLEKFGEVGYVSLPRFEDGTAKGFAFVEFEGADAAKRCAAQGVDGVTVVSKHEWVNVKENLKQQRKFKRELARKSQEIDDVGFPLGVLLLVQGLSVDVKRQQIYEAMEGLAPVAYVEFRRKHPERCFVRFHTARGATAAAASIREGFAVAGHIVRARVLRGEEEAEKWKAIHAETTEKQDRRLAGAETLQGESPVPQTSGAGEGVGDDGERAEDGEVATKKTKRRATKRAKTNAADESGAVEGAEKTRLNHNQQDGIGRVKKRAKTATEPTKTRGD